MSNDKDSSSCGVVENYQLNNALNNFFFFIGNNALNNLLHKLWSLT